MQESVFGLTKRFRSEARLCRFLVTMDRKRRIVVGCHRMNTDAWQDEPIVNCLSYLKQSHSFEWYGYPNDAKLVDVFFPSLLLSAFVPTWPRKGAAPLLCRELKESLHTSDRNHHYMIQRYTKQRATLQDVRVSTPELSDCKGYADIVFGAY